MPPKKYNIEQIRAWAKYRGHVIETGQYDGMTTYQLNWANGSCTGFISYNKFRSLCSGCMRKLDWDGQANG